MTRRTVWILAIVLVLLTATSIAYRALSPAKFNPVQWQSADSPQQLLARREMLPDINKLFANGQIYDKPSAQRYLGTPQQRDEQTDANWFYDLGGEPSAAAPGPSQWLELRLSDSGQLTSHFLRNDWLPLQSPQQPSTASGTEVPPPR